MKKEHHHHLSGLPPQARSSALSSAFRILTRRDHTRMELAAKLRKKGFDRVSVEAALTRCHELGYLDDAKTASLVAGHLADSGYGPLRIRHALRQKGLDDAIVEAALARCGDEETQVRRARHVLEKKTARLSREADAGKRRQKAYRFLAGRGFPSAVIKQAISKI
jgi:regulatory protein